MTLAVAIERPNVSLSRWCKWCGHAVTDQGRHHPDGKFDPLSVHVSEGEIMLAVIRSPMSKTESTVARRAKAHYAIALGKHIGVYQPE